MKLCIAAFVVLVFAATETAGVVNDRQFCSDERWRIYDGDCYALDNVYQSLSYAKDACADYWQSNILSVNSARQLDFIQNFTSYDTDYWLDLYRRTDGVSPGWYWGDGTPFVPTVLKWNKGLESVSSNAEFGLTTQGTLVPIRESGPNGYICEVKPTDQTCPPKFTLIGDTCFFASNLSNIDGMAYDEWWASLQCSKMADRSKLLEIRSEEKMRTVKKLITVQSPFAWHIGLKVKKYNWTWISDSSDASSVKNATYIKWANENDNLGGEENCAVMFVRRPRIRDVICKHRKAIRMCVKPKILPMFPPKFSCPYRDWMRGDTSCYLVLEKLQTWSNARANCQKLGGDLIKIPWSPEARWVRQFMWRGAAWTGLCYENEAWRWRDGQLLDNEAIKWNAEPNALPGASCAVINEKGELVAKSCHNHYRYVCEMPVKEEAKCPRNWSYFNQSCYILAANDRTTWPDASCQCRALADKHHFSYVFYPKDVGEIDYVVKTFLPKIVRSKEEGNSPLYIWTLLTNGNNNKWGYTYDWHKNIETGHLNWRKSPSEEATKTNGAYCAVFDGGFLVDHPKSATFKSVCQRPLSDGCGEMNEPN